MSPSTCVFNHSAPARVALAGIACLAAASLVAGGSSFSEFKTSDGSFLLRFSDSADRFERLRDGSRKFKVREVSGFSKSQGLTYTADRANGVMKPTMDAAGKAAFLLESATLDGHARATVDGAGSSTTLEGPEVVLAETADELSMTVPRDAKVTSNGGKGAEDRKLVATSGRAEASMEPFASKAEQRVRSATLSGGVTFDLDTVESAGTEKQRQVRTKLHLTSARCTLKATKEGGKTLWTIHFPGAVKAVGDQTEGESTLTGSMTLSKVRVVLNEKFELVEFVGGDEEGGKR